MDAPQTPPVNGEIGSRMGVRFYRYRGMLKRYWWVLLITIGIGLTYEGWVLLTKQSRYSSVGKLSVREMGSDNQASLGSIGDSSWYGTIRANLTSASVLDRAKNRAKLQKPETESLLETVRVSAENDQGTYNFSVTGSGEQPGFTQFYVDMVMEAFMEQRREESKKGIGQHNSQLTENLRREDGILKTAKGALATYVEAENVPFIEDERARLSNELADAKKDKEDIVQELNIAKNLSEGASPTRDPGDNRERTTGRDRAPTGGSGGSEGLVEAQKRLAVLQSTLQEKLQNWTLMNPRIKAMQRDIKDVEQQLKVYATNWEKDRTARIAQLNASLLAKNEMITELEEKAKKFSVIAGRYQTLKEDVDIAQKQYNNTRELLNAGDKGAVEILAISQPASGPILEPRNVFRHLATGLLGGLLIGLVVLFLLDRADDRLASSSEMIEQFSEPILGQIPDVADSRTMQGLPLLQDDDERFMFSEAFRSLRSSLIFMPNQKELKTLIITSAIPNEGKSTVASNLAITMANAGARVLLVDADLRRGDIAALFDTDGRQGLSNILRGEVPWKACVQNVRGEHLHIIPRGPVTNQSGELLLKPIVPKLLEEWKATFDLVIFNTAPILATDDTPTLAPNFDGTLMVIRASFTSARLTRNSLNALYQRQVNVLGLIMNCVDTELPDYYYYRYPKYYAA